MVQRRIPGIRPSAHQPRGPSEQGLRRPLRNTTDAHHRPWVDSCPAKRDVSRLRHQLASLRFSDELIVSLARQLLRRVVVHVSILVRRTATPSGVRSQSGATSGVDHRDNDLHRCASHTYRKRTVLTERRSTYRGGSARPLSWSSSPGQDDCPAPYNRLTKRGISSVDLTTCSASEWSAVANGKSGRQEGSQQLVDALDP